MCCRSGRAPRMLEPHQATFDLSRRLDDSAPLVFALNGVFMQSCARADLAPRRDEIRAELVALAARHGLVTFEILEHLIRLQARSELADFPSADAHATAADGRPSATNGRWWASSPSGTAHCGSPPPDRSHRPRPPTWMPPRSWTALACPAWNTACCPLHCCAWAWQTAPHPRSTRPSTSTRTRTGAYTGRGPTPSPCCAPEPHRRSGSAVRRITTPRGVLCAWRVLLQ